MKHRDGEEQTAHLRLRWALLGEMAIDNSDKLAFPKAPSSPGLYKFCIAQSGLVRRIYIGESDNLARRFSHYRNPGPTQQTNIRMNRILVEHLREAGASLTVLTITQDCWMATPAEELRADLSSKLVRRMFEHFAAATHRDSQVQLLNL
jgi:hypothetical protein